jgi:hypothetical protein
MVARNFSRFSLSLIIPFLARKSTDRYPFTSKSSSLTAEGKDFTLEKLISKGEAELESH